MIKQKLSDRKFRLMVGPGLVVFLLVLVLTWIFDWRSGLLVTVSLAVTACVGYWLLRSRKDKLVSLFSVDSSGEVKAQNRLLRNLPYPYAIVNQTGRIIWFNQAFNKSCTADVLRQRSLQSLFPELEGMEFQEHGVRAWHVAQGDMYYKLLLEKIPESLNIGLNASGDLYALCLNDETEAVRLNRKMKEQRPVIGTAYLDNYEEISGNMEAIRLSLVMANIDRKVTRYFTSHGGICKKIDKDKYFLTIPEYHLDEMMEDRFSILEEVRSTKIGNDQHITMSIGFGNDGEGTYEGRAESSRVALDMALGRGGDQVAVKTGDDITYFGGSAQSVNRNTRVRARVKAHALRELLMKHDDVLIMGHRIPDFDALGAATGVYRIVTAFGKHAHIVMENTPAGILPMRERLEASNKPEMFITAAQAELHQNHNTLLVVVDTNRGSFTEAPRLLEKFQHQVVIDHHRLANDSISNTALSYVEPYASSACEMVVEILQYMGETIRVPLEEADAMYAGIVLDTNNFINRTGVRTFEAAAFLRRFGADASRVKKQLFREDLNEAKAKAEALHSCEIFMDRFALSKCITEGLDSPTVACAQAANEMLNIKNIEASFVMTAVDDKIHISARSNDAVNVQIIMERLGGGGHGTMAGAQMSGCEIDEAFEYVKVTIQEMIKEGAIQ